MPAERGPNRELYLTEKGREDGFSDLGTALANLTEGILIFGADGHLLAANQAALDVHGYQRIEELDYVPGELAASLEVFSLRGEKISPEKWPIARALRGERFSSQEVQIHRLHDGSSWIGRYGGTPVLDKEGKIRQVVLTVRNITREVEARQRLEMAEQRAQHLAKAGEELASSLDYEETLQRVADLMVPEFADWCVVTVGEDPADLKQVAIAHENPDKVEWAWRIHELYPPEPDSRHGTPGVIRTGEVEFHPEITDEMLQSAAQDQRHLDLLREVGFRSAIIVPLLARGRTLGALTFVCSEGDADYDERDVQFARDLATRAALAVDNARLYREAVEARQAAEAANRAKGAFLANMSHEIRTPLTTVTGFLSLLGEDSDDREKYVELIQAGAERLQEMLESIMMLARLEAGKSDLMLERIDVADEAEEVAQLLETKARRKGLYLSFVRELGDSSRAALLDPGAVTSILNNLISNAIKFTSDGGVTVSVGLEEKDIFVRVQDTGPGVDEAFLEDLFEPFEQESTGMGRTHQGSGLGLAIAKKLVDAMGGTIEVDSIKGEGCTFTVKFPLAEVPLSVEADEEGSSSSGASTTSASGDVSRTQQRILVVEDNPDIQTLIASLLGHIHEVDMAATAQEALRKARQTRYDLVLLDIHLQGAGDGLQVLKQLRTDRAYGKTPMVAMTAYALPGDREQFLRDGFDEYVSKPFKPDEFREITSRLLEAAGSAAEKNHL